MCFSQEATGDFSPPKERIKPRKRKMWDAENRRHSVGEINEIPRTVKGDLGMTGLNLT